MPNFPHWSLSQQSRDRMNDLLTSASELGLDPDAVAAGGLAALQALIALKRAKEAGEGAGRTQLITLVHEAVRGLDPAIHRDLLQQIQSRVLALQGRKGDTEVAHVTPGEIVLPKDLQTPKVLGALSKAAADANIPLDQLRIGSDLNSINPATGRPEFASLPQEELEEIAIAAPRETGAVQIPQDIPDEFRVYGELGGEGRTPFSVGDLSKPDLSPWDDHSKRGDHTKGTGIDISPIRTDGKNARVTYRDPAYDREATQRLVDTFRATGGVEQVFFNDPEIKGVTPDPKGVHDNHLHVRVNPSYRRPPRG